MLFNVQTNSSHYHDTPKIRQRVTYGHARPEISPLLQKWIAMAVLAVFSLALAVHLLIQWRINVAEERIEAMQNIRLERATENIALLAQRNKLSSEEHIAKLAATRFHLLPPTKKQLR